MRQEACKHCGDVVCVPQKGEEVINGETPLEHLERTGHAYNSAEIHVCEVCGYVWPYTGESNQPTCPNCKGKRTKAVE